MTLSKLKKLWRFSYLLNIDANPKTVKGQKLGYMTAVLYLAPWKTSGYNVCPMAVIAGCWKECLNVQGRGGISKGGKRMRTPAGLIPANDIQRARIQRTKMWAEARPDFCEQLVKEIRAFLKRAKRKGLTPTVRLNGMSDIQWERIDIGHELGIESQTIFEMFPDTIFYDYTKIAKRFKRELPSNYHLSLSYSDANEKYAAACWEAHGQHGASLVMVYRTKDDIAQARNWYQECNVNFVDGDAHDLRFLDPAKSIVALKAKGGARHDKSGFVLDFK